METLSIEAVSEFLNNSAQLMAVTQMNNSTHSLEAKHEEPYTVLFIFAVLLVGGKLRIKNFLITYRKKACKDCCSTQPPRGGHGFESRRGQFSFWFIS